MDFLPYVFQFAAYSVTRGRLEHALVWAHPVLQQSENVLRVDHAFEGISLASHNNQGTVLFADEAAAKPILSPRSASEFPFQCRHADVFRRDPRRSMASTDLEALLELMPALQITDKKRQGSSFQLLAEVSWTPIEYEPGLLSESVRREIRSFLTGSPIAGATTQKVA